MDSTAYHALRDLQDRHWWFVGRRKIIAGLIRRYTKLAKTSRILEAGCGYGGNLTMLSQFGQLDAFEYESDARAYAATILQRPVAPGFLPDQIGFDDDRFEMIAMLDVLEHIDDDIASLKTLSARLTDNGAILITVPALPWLWSQHDEIHHHKRRYTKIALKQVLQDAGLQPLHTGYFNTLLFPLAVAQRLAQRLHKHHNDSNAMPNRFLNSILEKIFSFERHVIGRVGMPIGLSLYAIAVPIRYARTSSE